MEKKSDKGLDARGVNMPKSKSHEDSVDVTVRTDVPTKAGAGRSNIDLMGPHSALGVGRKGGKK